jgi:demethylmenaquinone methyltransferase / 2-methoxy-6-polyprenyl-1,4-benzoquinol methylase
MSDHVHQMFSQIAPRYDATNDVLSMGVHRLWRRVAVAHSQVKPGDHVLDCATGTGDLALAFKRAVGPSGTVLGTDFNAQMLSFAPAKAQAAGLDVTFEVADAMKLPYDTGRFTVASISFGIRNVDDPKACVAELARVVRPGGRVVVLEFGQPGGLFGACFRLYAKYLMPALGQLLTGSRAAYEYLPRTMASFPAGARFTAMMQETGAYSKTEAHPLLWGLAYVYVGTVR